MRLIARAQLPTAPAFAVCALMILWAAHDGGYDADTWYWGALVLLALLTALVGTRAGALRRIPVAVKVALLAFGLYVAWSYLSILWAGYAGDALTGSNRALMYWLVFAVFALTPWSPGRALFVLAAYTIGIGVVGAVILTAMASAGQAGTLFSGGRLVSPTGYFNAAAALFTMGAFLAVALAERRELPAPLRGVLIAISCGCLELALLGESRGWLFTLPFLLVAAMLVVRERLRIVVISLIPLCGTLVALQPLLSVFKAANAAHSTGATVNHAAQHAGRTGLLACLGALLVGTLLAVGDSRVSLATLPPPSRRALGALATVVAVGVAATGAIAATHGHAVPFIKRQWHGFTHPGTPSHGGSGSNFATVGSGRYDFWRVALDATLEHPVGGLGQDNFGDFYNRHRATKEETQWTHSYELRLLVHTGMVGTLLFAAFLVASLVAAVRSRRVASPLGAALSGAALLPLCVWLVHGSVDWFWEIPALSGPALAFLALAGKLGQAQPEAATQRGLTGAGPRLTAMSALGRQVPRPAVAAASAAAVAAAVITLGFPYLSVRDASTASDLRGKNPVGALSLLNQATDLNPLDAEAPRLAGLVALQSGRPVEAERRFTQARERQPGGWFAWFGEGLAASALGDVARARHAYAKAERINNRQPAVSTALARVNSTRPLTPDQALAMLVFAH